MAKKKKEIEAKKNLGSLGKDDKIVFAFLAAFLSIIGFIIALIAKKDDKYVMFYAKQSLVVFIVAVIVQIINEIVAFIPIIGTTINVVLSIFVVILWLTSWIYALSNKEKEVPVIGKYARKIKL
jgi:uncharacterized membrane protein